MKRLRSAQIFRVVMNAHAELAVQLVSKARSTRSNDPTSQYLSAAVVIFLAGVDKTLGLALQLCYIAGKITWKWLRPRKPNAGVISCGPGLTAKLDKLRELGLDLTELQWLVDLRNMYLHSCSIYAGYRVEPSWRGKPRLTLRASGPEVTSSGAFIVPFSAGDIRRMADQLTERVGKFLDKMNWQSHWKELTKKIERLPKDPHLEASRLPQASADEIHSIVTSLNKRYVGEGFHKIMSVSVK